MSTSYERLFKSNPDGRVECNVCHRRCSIQSGSTGFCGGYANTEGSIIDLTYGRPTTAQITELGWAPVIDYAHASDPVLSVGSRGCSDRCNHCINYAHAFQKHETEVGRNLVSPDEIVDYALATGCKGVAGNFNESLLALKYWEEIYSLAKRKGLYTVAVTNGSSTPEAIDVIARHLDVYRCDIKAHRKQTAKLQGNLIDPSKVFESLKHVKNVHPSVHIELVTMIHQGINDNPQEIAEISRWIATELGSATPWSISPMHEVKMARQKPPEYIKATELVRPNGEFTGQKITFQNDGYTLSIGPVDPQMFPPIALDASVLRNLENVKTAAMSQGLSNVHIKIDGR